MTGPLSAHAHHVSVHFVVANYVMALVFAALFLLTGTDGSETASYYTLCAAILFTPAGFISGVMIWRGKYKGRWAGVFRKKFIIAMLLALIGLVAVNMRYLNPDLLAGKGAATAFYTVLLGLCAVCVMALGYYGGKLTIR